MQRWFWCRKDICTTTRCKGGGRAITWPAMNGFSCSKTREHNTAVPVKLSHSELCSWMNAVLVQGNRAAGEWDEHWVLVVLFPTQGTSQNTHVRYLFRYKQIKEPRQDKIVPTQERRRICSTGNGFYIYLLICYRCSTGTTSWTTTSAEEDTHLGNGYNSEIYLWAFPIV